MYTCVYVYIYIYIHTYIHAYIHTYINMCIYIYVLMIILILIMTVIRTTIIIIKIIITTTTIIMMIIITNNDNSRPPGLASANGPVGRESPCQNSDRICCSDRWCCFCIVLCYGLCLFSGEAQPDDTRGSVNERNIQNQSFAPAYSWSLVSFCTVCFCSSGFPLSLCHAVCGLFFYFS